MTHQNGPPQDSAGDYVRVPTGNTVDERVETVFTEHMTTCTGTIYHVNPDAPEEGTDIHHVTPCPAHPDADLTLLDPSLPAEEYHRRYVKRFGIPGEKH